MIMRHFIDVGGRRVHYRCFGSGPPLLMVHQSPCSSAELEPLMRRWGDRFTCIAPDTPGFGQSAPLAGTPEIEDFGDALIALLDALGLSRCAAYGFHSGGIILMNALRRRPHRFSGVAIGGYAIWTPEEMALFGDRYLPPFQPQPYGEHLTWLWNRILEQSWFFPWFDTRHEARLSNPHDDPVRVHATVMDMLNAGDAYRAGYGAVLRAPRDIPLPDADMPPVLITAYDGDPLQSHIDRLGPMPGNWTARKVSTPDEQQDASIAFLSENAPPSMGALPHASNEGFARITTDDFDGLIHWHGLTTAAWLTVHAPGSELRAGQALALDLPGHGLSDPWLPKGGGIAPWLSFMNACRTHFGIKRAEGKGWSAVLGTREAERPSRIVAERLIPDLTPDRFGAYLTRAWSVARAARIFDPWYEANAAHVTDVDSAELDPAAIARDARALLRATAARPLMLALAEGDG